MKIQKFKIECNGTNFFFTDHALKTAEEHAMAFVERNKENNNILLYSLNTNSFGEKWILKKAYYKK